VNVRGALTIFVIGLVLVLGDLVQRTLIAGSARLFPGRRIWILSKWQQFYATYILFAVRHIGGATIDPPVKVPGKAGTLIVMNHQSVLDIPLVVAAVRPTYPRIVTRSRYARGKPLISHMVRLYQYPTVDPRAMKKRDVLRVADQAATSDVPMVIYPEGTRSKTGRIGRFRRAGISAILAARRWEVYVVTIDGYWVLRTLDDFLSRSSRIQGRMRVSGPFESPSPTGEHEDAREDPILDAFIEELEQTMRSAMADMRGEAPAADVVADPGQATDPEQVTDPGQASE